MPRMIAYLCNDDSLTPVALRQAKASLDVLSPADSGGFGFGWLQGGRSLLRTTPRPGKGSAELLDLMADLRTRSCVGVIRDPEQGHVDPLDMQPFRFRRWLFAHTGEQVELPEIHAELLQDVPGFVASNIKGTTSAEVFGHLFLSELHSRNLLESRVDREACSEALAEAIRKIQIGVAVAKFAGLAVSERTLIAGGIGHELHYREFRGISQLEEPLFAGHKPKSTDHPSFKAILVTNAPTNTDDWVPIPDGQLLWIDRHWDVHFTPVSA